MSALLSAAGEQHVHPPTATETGIHSHLEQLRRAKKMEGRVRRVRVNLWIRVTPHLHGAVSADTDALRKMISRITLKPAPLTSVRPIPGRPRAKLQSRDHENE